MLGKSEINIWTGLAGIARVLPLLLALLFPAAAIAQITGGSLVSSMGASGDSCASAPDRIACYRGLAGSQQGGMLMVSQQLNGRDANAAAAPVADTQQPSVKQETKIIEKAVGLENTEFQAFVARTAGKTLPMFGYNLFRQVPDTFAPVDNIPVTADYLVGPGDELIIKGWGQVDIDVRAVIDRNGVVTLPKAGSINVAGVRYQDLHSYLKQAIGRVFRNFELNVTLGKLRSIQVFVVGQAQRPGVYTVSSLSTLVNTLFASGGPSPVGSLRHIQVKRNGALLTELDMYDLLLKGDKTKDVALLPGDVIYIPPVGQLVGIYGGVNNAAIYELKDDKTSLSGVLELAGGLTTTAAGQKVLMERIEQHAVRKVEEFRLDKEGLAHLVKDGDLIQVFSIDARFYNAVTLHGNVAAPGRYPWKEGMRVKDLITDMESLIVPEYWLQQNQTSRDKDKAGHSLQNEIKHSVAEINWNYAIIERLNRVELTTQLLPFNLAKAINSPGSDQNLLLHPGDTITIFSKEDIQVPMANRSVFVRLEGEVTGAGVYKALPGETLRQMLVRVGGLTPHAYLYGAEFSRETVREMQQKKLSQMVAKMEEAVQRNLSSKTQEALTPEEIESSKAQASAQEMLVERMRKAQATGRIVLEIPPDNRGEIDDLPDLALEDGDTFRVPAKPSVVSVMGMVYNENAFIYRPGKRVGDYIEQAGGPTRDADESRMYVLRADGSVMSAQNSNAIFNSFSGAIIMPGDTVIVPEMLDKFSLTKEVKDWAQIFYQFALGVGAIKLLGL